MISTSTRPHRLLRLGFLVLLGLAAGFGAGRATFAADPWQTYTGTDAVISERQS